MHSLRQRINTRDESGFTLIELLVVLIIIGVLLAIAVPSYLGFRDRAQIRAAESNVRSAVPTAEAYMESQTGANEGTYTGMSLSGAGGLLTIDQATKLDPDPNGVKVNTGNTQYCLQDTVGSHSAYYIGPLGGAGSWDATLTKDGPQEGTCP